jgi:type II secretory pathway pseudopilin PulG
MITPEAPPARGMRGFTYIGLMLMIVFIGIALAGTGVIWSAQRTREKEAELLFIGDQFRKAIAAYHARNLNVGDGFPKSCNELLQDPHQATVQRYLRKVYADPFTGKPEWGLVKGRSGGIIGVYSLAPGIPRKQVGFPAIYDVFAGADSYEKWRFVVAEAENQVAPPAASSDATANAPVATAGPALASEPPAPPLLPPVPKKKPGEPPSCAYVAALDAHACALEKIKWGDDSECQRSARLRAGECASGVPPPDLPSLQVRMGGK